MKDSNSFIISSLLDTDLYKLTMQQAILLGNLHTIDAVHRLICRTPDVDFSPYIKEIREEIDHLCELRFTDDEIDYLRSLPYFRTSYLEYIGYDRFKLKRDDIKVSKDDKAPGKISITIKGNWFHTILFETPVLAILSEVYARNEFPDISFGKDSEGFMRLNEKIELMANLPDYIETPENNRVKPLIPFGFADFGTRRRISKKWQEIVLRELKERAPEGSFLGTSNIEFAKKLGIKPIGTQAHEWIQAGQALPHVALPNSQKYMLELWAQIYRGQLGIALADTLTTDKFLEDFDLFLAKVYDGVRLDSGDPFSGGEKIIEHYRKLGMDPATKTLIFSDNLTWPKAIELWRHFGWRIKTLFGIGTNLLNDFPEKTAIQIVIKMVECNGHPVAKLSDDEGKTIAGNQEYLRLLKKNFGLS